MSLPWAGDSTYHSNFSLWQCQLLCVNYGENLIYSHGATARLVFMHGKPPLTVSLTDNDVRLKM